MALIHLPVSVHPLGAFGLPLYKSIYSHVQALFVRSPKYHWGTTSSWPGGASWIWSRHRQSWSSVCRNGLPVQNKRNTGVLWLRVENVSAGLSQRCHLSKQCAAYLTHIMCNISKQCACQDLLFGDNQSLHALDKMVDMVIRVWVWAQDSIRSMVNWQHSP